MAVNFPPTPDSLKQIQHYLKVAQEHDARDPIVAYWSRLYALQMGLKLSSQQADETKLLLSLMDYLETQKKESGDNESITNEVAAQAYLDNYALKLFLYADKQDREGNFNKNVVKAFYTSGMIYDVLLTFGELTEESQHNRKYAKWKAAYIHTCLKNGETPISGPMQDENEAGVDAGEEEGAVGGAPAPASTPSYGFDLPSTPNEAPMPQPRFEPGPPLNPEPFQPPARLPSPPSEPERNPGGFEPFDATKQIGYMPPVNPESVHLSPEQLSKAQKYCKWAGSSLMYEDVKTAVDNLQKALRLLQTGQDE